MLSECVQGQDAGNGFNDYFHDFYPEKVSNEYHSMQSN